MVVTTDGTIIPQAEAAGRGSGRRRRESRGPLASSDARGARSRHGGEGHGAERTRMRVTADIDSARTSNAMEDHYDPADGAPPQRRPPSSVAAREDPHWQASPARVEPPKQRLGTGSKEADGGAPRDGRGRVLPAGRTHVISKSITSAKRVVAGGVLRRMTVAVVIDGTRSKGTSRQDRQPRPLRGQLRRAPRRHGHGRSGCRSSSQEEPKAVTPPAMKIPCRPGHPKRRARSQAVSALLVLAVWLKLRSSRSRRRPPMLLALVALGRKASAEQVTIEGPRQDAKEDGTRNAQRTSSSRWCANVRSSTRPPPPSSS